MCTVQLTVSASGDDPFSECVQLYPGGHRCKTAKMPGHTTIDEEFTKSAAIYEGGEDFEPAGPRGRMQPKDMGGYLGKYKDSNFQPFMKSAWLLKLKNDALTCSAGLRHSGGTFCEQNCGSKLFSSVQNCRSKHGC